MKEKIVLNIDNPQELERLYRNNKSAFTKEFEEVYPEFQDHISMQIWYERLYFERKESNDISWGKTHDLLFVLIASFFSGLVAKIPKLVSIDSEFFYERNTAFIVLPFLMGYFIFQNKPPLKYVLVICSTVLISLLYINMLPHNDSSDSIFLASIHLPLFLWSVTGLTYTGSDWKNNEKRLGFLRFNGDLVVLTTIILIGGGLLMAITLGLFNLIHVNIEKFYMNYVVVWGLAASPIVATYLIRMNPQLVNKVSPVIAKVFTPLVLITLVFYILAVFISGNSPYDNREFLLIFNFLLLGVMAIILFSVAATSKESYGKLGLIPLLLLSLATIVVNIIALSAIVMRIVEWGFSPNKIAVLGGNILILTHLCQVTFQIFKSLQRSNSIDMIEEYIAKFLPFYCAWALIVSFFFPFIFGFR